MPDVLTTEQEKISTRANVCQVRTDGLKKGLRKQVQILSAKKKDYVSKNLTAPHELLTFLRSEDTLAAVMEAEDRTTLRR